MNLNEVLRNQVKEKGIGIYELSRKVHIYEPKLKMYLQDGIEIPKISLIQLGAVFPVFNKLEEQVEEPIILPSPPKKEPRKYMETIENRYNSLLEFISKGTEGMSDEKIGRMFSIAPTIFPILQQMGLISRKKNHRKWIGGEVTKALTLKVISEYSESLKKIRNRKKLLKNMS